MGAAGYVFDFEQTVYIERERRNLETCLLLTSTKISNWQDNVYMYCYDGKTATMNVGENVNLSIRV